MNNKVELPPLMSALDTYIDIASENRVDDLINQAKKKKKKVKKQKVLSRSDSFPPPSIAQQFSPDMKRPDSLKESKVNKSPRAIKLSKLPDENTEKSLPNNREYLASYSISSPSSNISPKKKLQNLKANNDYSDYTRHVSESTPQAAATVQKTTTGFNKAVESIAALKLHNYVMKRRVHMAQKLKVSISYSFWIK
jgi:hypothetical protein